jgi:integrase
LALSNEQAQAISHQNDAQKNSLSEGQEQQQRPRIYLVTDGLHSKHTKTNYRLAFNQFLKHGAKVTDLQVLLDYPPRTLEAMIIGYVEKMRDEGKAHQTIKLHCAAIFRFFRLNDITVNQRKISLFVPPNESTHSDKAYTVGQITQIWEASDRRTKLIVLLMASTGMRLGAIPELRVGHLTPIPEYNLYQIEVYATSRAARHISYCTPECRAAIDAYVYGYREGLGEKITDESPLIREMFDSHNPFIINAPKPSTEKMIYDALEQALKRSRVNQRVAALGKGKRRSIMRSHGFRKFFFTAMKKAKIQDDDIHALVGHRAIRGLNINYDRTPNNDRLLEYVKSIPFLTINPKQRLEQENAELRKNQNDILAEFGDFRHEFNEMKRLFVHLTPGTQKKLVDGFREKVGDEADIEWSCDD